MSSFKIYIGDEIRRFRLGPADLSYEKFTEKLRENIKNYHLEMKTYYEDGEKDKIVFSSELEFAEMIACLKELQQPLSLIKIWIEDSKIPYFRDGSAEVTRLYEQKGENSKDLKIEGFTSASQKVKDALARLFPDHAILPYNIPSYLKEVFAVKVHGPADVELDIVVDKLIQSINDEALRLMDSEEAGDLSKSKVLLESLQMIDSEDPHVYYNLACVHSLMKDVQPSFDQLRLAFQHGYSNLKHMLEDPDLAYLRLNSQFNEFLKSIAPEGTNDTVPLVTPVQPVNTEQPVTVEIPRVDEPVKIEAPKIEPKVEEKKKPERWAEQIEVIKAMGFDVDDDVLMVLLDDHKGNCETTLQDLFDLKK